MALTQIIAKWRGTVRFGVILLASLASVPFAFAQYPSKSQVGKDGTVGAAGELRERAAIEPDARREKFERRSITRGNWAA